MSATSLYTQRLDHLGIVAGVYDEIGLVEIIDQTVPTAPTACKCRASGEGDKVSSCGLGILKEARWRLTSAWCDPFTRNRVTRGRVAKGREPASPEL